MGNLHLTIALASVLLVNTSCKKESLPDADGTVIWKTVKEEKNGTGYEEKVFQYNSTGEFIGFKGAENELMFDNQNRLVKYREFTYEYNQQGQISKRSDPSRPPGHIGMVHSYTYDAIGRLIADTMTSVEGKLDFHSYLSYTYDNNNNVISSRLFVYNNQTAQFDAPSTTTFSYDGHPNPYSSIGLRLYHMNEVPNAIYLSKEINKPSNSSFYSFYSNGFIRIMHEDTNLKDYNTTFYYK